MFKFLRKTALYILAIPTLFIVLGAASNQAVIIANHDTFPVLVNEYKVKSLETITLTDGTVLIDSTHCVMTRSTHLNFLADVFDFKDGIYSVGDLSLELGEWLWAFAPFVWAFAAVQKLRKYAE